MWWKAQGRHDSGCPERVTSKTAKLLSETHSDPLFDTTFVADSSRRLETMISNGWKLAGEDGDGDAWTTTPTW